MPGAATFHTAHMSPPLYPHLQLIWGMSRPASAHPQERLLPSATTEIIFNLDEPISLIHNPLCDKGLQPYGGDIVSGPQVGWFAIGTHTPRRLIGLHFRAGGLAPFVKLPMGELTGRHISVEEIWGGEGRRLSDLLRSQNNFNIQVATLVAWLKKQLHRETHPAVAIACQFQSAWTPEARVAAIIDHLGFSRRHFNRLFQNAVGLTAKTFCRISRFQATIRHLETRKNVDWADLAIRFGYYDQAHLINEFQTFCGFTPATYLKRRGERLNHLPLWE